MSLEAVRVRLGDGFYAGAMRNPTQQPGWPVHSERQTSLGSGNRSLYWLSPKFLMLLESRGDTRRSKC